MKETRKVIFEDGGFETKVYDRYALLCGHTFEGPALVEENASVTVVRPGYKGVVDAYGNLRITRN